MDDRCSNHFSGLYLPERFEYARNVTFSNAFRKFRASRRRIDQNNVDSGIFQLEPQRLRQSIQRELGCAVDAGQRQSSFSGNGSDVDDLPASLRPHDRNHQLARIQWGFKIKSKDFSDDRRRRSFNTTEESEAGIVNQDVDTPELTVCPFNHLAHGLALSQIERQINRLRALFFNRLP